MWVWFAILFIISIISLSYSFYIYVPFFARYRFINKFFHFIEAKKKQTFSPYAPLSPISTNVITTDDNQQTTLSFNTERRQAFVQWLQRDGVFLLHLLNSHAGEPLTIKCVEDLLDIWMNNYEEQSKLADQLLKNKFQFSQ